MTDAIQFHPIANLFPLLEGDAFAELVAREEQPLGKVDQFEAESRSLARQNVVRPEWYRAGEAAAFAG